MQPRLTRRTVLHATAGLAPLTLAGCLGSDMRSDAVVWAERSPTPDPAHVVRFADLPPAEQEIARTAIRDGFYHACPDLPDAVRSFAERVSGRAPSYLAHENESYALWVRISDMVYASSASPSDEGTVPDCSFL